MTILSSTYITLQGRWALHRVGEEVGDLVLERRKDLLNLKRQVESIQLRVHFVDNVRARHELTDTCKCYSHQSLVLVAAGSHSRCHRCSIRLKRHDFPALDVRALLPAKITVGPHLVAVLQHQRPARRNHSHQITDAVAEQAATH